MKKIATIIAGIILSASCKQKIVYVKAQQLNDSSVLKAEFKLGEWKGLFAAIVKNTAAIEHARDTSEIRKAKDTLSYVIMALDRNLSDSNRNPIFKK